MILNRLLKKLLIYIVMKKKSKQELVKVVFDILKYAVAALLGYFVG